MNAVERSETSTLGVPRPPFIEKCRILAGGTEPLPYESFVGIQHVEAAVNRGNAGKYDTMGMAVPRTAMPISCDY